MSKTILNTCENFLNRYIHLITASIYVQEISDDLSQRVKNFSINGKAYWILIWYLAASLHRALHTALHHLYSMCTLNRSLHAPTTRHIGIINSLMRYSSWTLALRIIYKSNPPDSGLWFFSNSYWAGFHDMMHSTTRGFFQINFTAIY